MVSGLEVFFGFVLKNQWSTTLTKEIKISLRTTPLKQKIAYLKFPKKKIPLKKKKLKIAENCIFPQRGCLGKPLGNIFNNKMACTSLLKLSAFINFTQH